MVRGEVKGGLGLNHDWARVPTHVATVRTRCKVCCKQEVVLNSVFEKALSFQFGGNDQGI